MEGSEAVMTVFVVFLTLSAISFLLTSIGFLLVKTAAEIAREEDPFAKDPPNSTE
jgi:hypothetical protein